MTIITAPTPPRANALACEYRPSMPADVLHLWAKDAGAELIRLQAELEARKPLTDEQIVEIWMQPISSGTTGSAWRREITRAIERAHGIGDKG